MKKTDEANDPKSCWNKAEDDERVFVLLAHDVAAPVAIRAWVRERIRLGKNVQGDAQITEALECASLMAEESYSPEYLDAEPKQIDHECLDKLSYIFGLTGLSDEDRSQALIAIAIHRAAHEFNNRE